MPLTDAQRAELEALRGENVRLKLLEAGPGRTASVPGLDTAPIRGDVEAWLAEKSGEEATERKQTLRWAKIAGWSAMIGVLVGIAAIIVSIWLARR